MPIDTCLGKSLRGRLGRMIDTFDTIFRSNVFRDGVGKTRRGWGGGVKKGVFFDLPDSSIDYNTFNFLEINQVKVIPSLFP